MALIIIALAITPALAMGLSFNSAKLTLIIGSRFVSFSERADRYVSIQVDFFRVIQCQPLDSLYPTGCDFRANAPGNTRAKRRSA
jgi:hypothetical protein